MIEDEIANAGDLTSAPKVDPTKLPKRWFPGIIRKLLQIAFLPFVLIDKMAVKIAAWLIKTPYKKEGACRRRGNCCYYIRMRKYRGPINFIQMFWATQINGFFLRQKKPVKYGKKQYFIMGCRHLQKDGSCKEYLLRPSICRKWPEIERFGEPNILKGCGYRAAPRNPENHSLKILQ